MHLMTIYLIDYSKDWIIKGSYIKQQQIIVALEDQKFGFVPK